MTNIHQDGDVFVTDTDGQKAEALCDLFYCVSVGVTGSIYRLDGRLMIWNR